MTDPSPSSIPMLQSESLLKLNGLRHGFFTRQGGISQGIYESLNCGLGSGDESATIHTNRSLAMHRLGAQPDCLLTPHQTHSTTVLTITHAQSHDTFPRADALVTNQPGLAIGIVTADCAPVIFADDHVPVIGIAHAGWRGALGGIIESTIQALCRLEAKTDRIHAAIGPCIGQKSYEVSAEFSLNFLDQDPKNQEWFIAVPSSDRLLFDLGGYITRRLEQAGLEHQHRLIDDTFDQEKRFFSYRRCCRNNESDYGRMLSAVMIDRS